MGGTYSYSLGHRINGQYQPLKNLHRKDFAIMADLPTDAKKSRQKETSGHASSGHHGATGQNVLFEDGHYEYMIDSESPSARDNFYLNDAGKDSAGLHVNDAVLVESGKGP